ncbi:MAG: 4Fe-4S dicluster domain-containing protein [Hyphomicrobiales bacterium]
MIKQILFILVLIITLAVFFFTIKQLIKNFRLTRPASFSWKEWPARVKMTLDVAFGQTKIFRRPIVGLMHALVFWGFLIITIGSLETVIDGVFNLERSFRGLGVVYDIIMACGDIFALLILIFIIAFIVRRVLMNVKRLKGTEIKAASRKDANIALSLIFLLMVSLLGMNVFYINSSIIEESSYYGVYPVSSLIQQLFTVESFSVSYAWMQIFWWIHILIIFVFANLLPYSKHFHVFLSIPNVFFSRLEPLGYVPAIESLKQEVELMLNPEAEISEAEASGEQETFGAKDAYQLSWKNYLDSLSCTECGRCTSVCPANITGKKLSPRKIMMDTRSRMKEIGKELKAENTSIDDGKSLLHDYITEEELWACTMCNACAMECPININQPSIILELRRYLVLEEAKAPTELQSMFTNIENNGAPWAFNQEDRTEWTNDLSITIKQ